jgi:crotonobetainyl-CoA:carnitine CoA-transferase CaiB-like acyl-CoA transferase
MTGILEGLTVVSMELMEATPAASVWLADWGADVIKVEPLGGEQFRGMAGGPGRSTGVNPRFQLLNRNKRSLAVDLKQPPGREIIYRLVKKADVFMSNNELGALDRLQMDFETLRKVNPRLIYAFINAYGTEGPDREGPGYDRVSAWARAGFQYTIGEPGSIPPSQRSGMMDRTVAPHLVAGVLAALLHRERTGEGQKLGVSLYQSAVWTIAGDVEMALAGEPLPRDDRTRAANPLWSTYRTRDNRWICLGMLRSEPYWAPFCRAIGRSELEEDERFADTESRRRNCVELIRLLDEVFDARDVAEWEERCREHGLIYARVQSPAEVATDPQSLANGFFTELNHPAGPLKVVASPVRFYQNPASVRTPAPEVGQHTEEILGDNGYAPEEIATLRAQKIIL